MAAHGQVGTATRISARTHHRLRTGRRLFDAALAEFRRRGVAQAQIEDIVRRAGVARGTFYLHFPTKDHVMMELVRIKQQGIVRDLDRAPKATLQEFLVRMAERMWEDAARKRPEIWHEMCAVIVRHADEMRSADNPLVTRLVERLEHAQREGQLRGDIAAFDLASLFLPGIYGLLQMKLGASRSEVRAALRDTVDIFVRGAAPVEGAAGHTARRRRRIQAVSKGEGSR